MSHTTEPHSFFSTPIWPRASFRGKHSRRRAARSSSSSSRSSHDGHDGASSFDDERHGRRRRSSSPSDPDGDGDEDDYNELNPLQTDSNQHLRGRHRKRQSALLEANRLIPIPHEPYTLRTRHLSVITTLLHHCLLIHDWERARRAFGLLIRGKDVDIRRIWGVGLDILLRLGERGSDGEGGGMEKAVEYLERLALFFPYRPRLHSNHPALMDEGEDDDDDADEDEEDRQAAESKGRKRRKPGSGVDERLKRKKEVEKRKRKKKKQMRELPPYVSAVEFNPLLFSLLIESSKEVDASEEGDGWEYGRSGVDNTSPERIKARLEELMLTPPWDGLKVLKLLRGMLCLWMVDVEKHREAMETRRRRRRKETDGDDEDDGDWREPDPERRARVEALRGEARDMFERLKKKGEVLPDGIEWWLVHFDDEDDEDGDEETGGMGDVDSDGGDVEEDEDRMEE